MNFRQMIGLVLLSIGVVLIVFAFHRLGYIHHKTPEMKIMTNSPVSPTEQLPEPSAVIVAGPQRSNGKIPLIAGIILVLIGALVAIRYKHS